MRTRRFHPLTTTIGAISLSAGLASAVWSQQGSNPVPVVAGVDSSIYCVPGDQLEMIGANFGGQGTRSYVTVSLPVADTSGKQTFQTFPLSISSWSNNQVVAHLFSPDGAQMGFWIATMHTNNAQSCAVAIQAEGCEPHPHMVGIDKWRSSALLQQLGLPFVNGMQKVSFSPTDYMVIHGSNFGSSPTTPYADGTSLQPLNDALGFPYGTGYVTAIVPFNDSGENLYYQEQRLPITEWSNTLIQVNLTPLSGATQGTGVVTVHRGDQETSSHAFTIGTATIPPPTPTPTPTPTDYLSADNSVISGLSRNDFCLKPNTELVIHGNTFLGEPNGSFVTVDNVPVTDTQGNISYQSVPTSVIFWSNNQIQVQFNPPANAVPGTSNVTLHYFRWDDPKKASADRVKEERTTSVATQWNTCP